MLKISTAFARLFLVSSFILCINYAVQIVLGCVCVGWGGGGGGGSHKLYQGEGTEVKVF